MPKSEEFADSLLETQAYRWLLVPHWQCSRVQQDMALVKYADGRDIPVEIAHSQDNLLDPEPV